jgi:hypothetical protein
MADQVLLIILAICSIIAAIALFFILFYFLKRFRKQSHQKDDSERLPLVENMEPIQMSKSSELPMERGFMKLREKEKRKESETKALAMVQAKEHALLTAQMYVRATDYRNPRLVDAGRREKKFFFTVEKFNQKAKYMMSLVGK